MAILTLTPGYEEFNPVSLSNCFGHSLPLDSWKLKDPDIHSTKEQWENYSADSMYLQQAENPVVLNMAEDFLTWGWTGEGVLYEGVGKPEVESPELVIPMSEIAKGSRECFGLPLLE